MTSSHSGASGLSVVRRSEVVCTYIGGCKIVNTCTLHIIIEIVVGARAYVRCTEVIHISECRGFTLCVDHETFHLVPVTVVPSTGNVDMLHHYTKITVVCACVCVCV